MPNYYLKQTDLDQLDLDRLTIVQNMSDPTLFSGNSRTREAINTILVIGDLIRGASLLEPDATIAEVPTETISGTDDVSKPTTSESEEQIVATTASETPSIPL